MLMGSPTGALKQQTGGLEPQGSGKARVGFQSDPMTEKAGPFPPRLPLLTSSPSASQVARGRAVPRNVPSRGNVVSCDGVSQI